MRVRIPTPPREILPEEILAAEGMIAVVKAQEAKTPKRRPKDSGPKTPKPAARGPEVNYATGKMKPSGRPPGSENKIPRSVKEGLLNAYNRLGGEDWLYRVGMENPKEFIRMLAKLIPVTLAAPDSTDGAEPITIAVNMYKPSEIKRIN